MTTDSFKGVEQGFFKEDFNPKELSRFMVSRFEGAILLAKAKKFLSPMEDIIWQGRNLLLKDERMHLANGWMCLTSET